MLHTRQQIKNQQYKHWLSQTYFLPWVVPVPQALTVKSLSLLVLKIHSGFVATWAYHRIGKDRSVRKRRHKLVIVYIDHSLQTNFLFRIWPALTYSYLPQLCLKSVPVQWAVIINFWVDSLLVRSPNKDLDNLAKPDSDHLTACFSPCWLLLQPCCHGARSQRWVKCCYNR